MAFLAENGSRRFQKPQTGVDNDLWVRGKSYHSVVSVYTTTIPEEIMQIFTCVVNRYFK